MKRSSSQHRGRPQGKPPLQIQPTTLWDYPSQNYRGRQGDIHYKGATPSYAIWNLLQRYTRPDDRVIDPFCGSGTTIDVATELGRKVRGFDVAPFRPDIEQADARHLPLEDASVDFVFMDPPYSTNIDYSEHPDCIGKISSADEAYFEAMDAVFHEAWRVMRNRRYMALYICDSYNKREGFVPIGMRCMALMMQYFRPIDHIAIVRHNRTLTMGNRRRAAEEGNFFMRGFNHLIIMKKEIEE